MYLLKRKLICMALYRLPGATDNGYAYVYTNPDYTTIISHRDRAFVLGIDIPDDLQGDIYEMVEKDKEVDLPGKLQQTEKDGGGNTFEDVNIKIGDLNNSLEDQHHKSDHKKQEIDGEEKQSYDNNSSHAGGNVA